MCWLSFLIGIGATLGGGVVGILIANRMLNLEWRQNG